MGKSTMPFCNCSMLPASIMLVDLRSDVLGLDGCLTLSATETVANLPQLPQFSRNYDCQQATTHSTISRRVKTLPNSSTFSRPSFALSPVMRPSTPSKDLLM